MTKKLEEVREEMEAGMNGRGKNEGGRREEVKRGKKERREIYLELRKRDNRKVRNWL